LYRNLNEAVSEKLKNNVKTIFLNYLKISQFKTGIEFRKSQQLDFSGEF